MIAVHAHLRLQDKALSLAAWGIGVGVFGSVGWMAIQPFDPEGAVSLTTARHAPLMLVEVLALAAIVSGLATALIGRKLPEAGAFAVALGLAAVNLRGDSAAYLLITVTGGDAAARSALAWKLAFEGIAWSATIVVALLAAGWLMRSVTGRDRPPGDLLYEDTALAELTSLRSASGDGGSRQRPWADGLKVTALSLVVAAILFRLLATGSPWRTVRHGQSYFALVAAFYFGGIIAYRYWRVRSPLWGCLAPPVLCLVGYAYCAVAASPQEPYRSVASVPPSAFFRALPVEYVCVGTVAAILAFWSARRHWLAHPGPRSPTADGRGTPGPPSRSPRDLKAAARTSRRSAPTSSSTP